jgi:hypothetical protein
MKRVFAFLAFGLLFACAPTNDALRAKLESRAKFDASCNELQLVPLEETSGYTTSYGVTGCGRRLTYVLNASTQSWILNAEDGHPSRVPPESPSPAPPPPSPPPAH